MVLAMFAPAVAHAKIVKKGKNVVTVEVTAEGMTEDEAKTAAMRKAVEEGAGTLIYSQSKVEDFVLVRDTVLSKATGFIQSKKFLSVRETDDDTFIVKLRAVVSVKGIADMWGTVKTLLEERGNPKIMVAINERIDGQVQEDSSLQSTMEEMLIKSGFDLVNKKHMKVIHKKKIQAAIADNKPDVVQAIAKEYGAQIFITGSADASSGGVRNRFGVRVFLYGADANVTCYRTDTSGVLYTKRATSTSTARVARPAASKALAKAGIRILPFIRQGILQKWMAAVEGRGMLQMVVKGIPKYKYYTKLKKELKKLDAIKSVNGRFSNKVAKLRVKSKVSAEKLAEIIGESMEDIIEITDVSQNVIEADYVSE